MPCRVVLRAGEPPRSLLLIPVGLKGIGEGVAIAPGACLANAVSDALAHVGVSVDATPLTPEAVLRLMRAAAG